MFRTYFAAILWLAISSSSGVHQSDAASPTESQASELLVGHTKPVTTLSWSRDSRMLASGGDDRSVYLWDVVTGKPKEKISEIVAESYGNPVFCFTNDLERIASCFWGKLSIRPFRGEEPIRFIDPILDRAAKTTFRPDVFAMAFSPDGKRLATAGSRATQGLPGGVVIVWQLDTAKPIYVFNTLDTAAGAIRWSRDGTRLVAGTNGVGGELPSPGEVLVWNMINGELIHAFKVKTKVEYGEWASAGDVAFSPDGKRVAASVTAGSRSTPAGLLIPEMGASLRMWDLESGSIQDVVTGMQSSLSRIDFSTDGKHVAGFGAEPWVRVWDVAQGTEVQTRQFAVRVSSIAFAPNGKTLAVGCRNGDVAIIHMQLNP